MTSGDRRKLLKAGFRIFRMLTLHKTITECIDGEWHKHGSYKSKAEMLRAWNELMKDEKNIGE